jgi:ubiquinone/menaquinone biosynthesis C-methylase UbiE
LTNIIVGRRTPTINFGVYCTPVSKMNASESNSKFLPKQATAPTPEHYNALVGDGMEKLAEASLTNMPNIPPGSTIHDNGCGTGAATAAILGALTAEASLSVDIKGTDIVEAAIDSYSSRARSFSWPAKGLVMDSNALSFPGETFSHSVGNALLFAGPSNDGIDVVKEMYRTLKPGGILLVNSLAYVPNLEPIQQASRETRPPGAPVPRQGLNKWSNPDFLASVVEAGGFTKEKLSVHQCEYFVTTPEFHYFCTLLWSFIGGTTTEGWSQEDEQRWDEAVEIVKRELIKTKGFKMLDDGRAVLRFVANVAVAIR